MNIQNNIIETEGPILMRPLKKYFTLCLQLMLITFNITDKYMLIII